MKHNILEELRKENVKFANEVGRLSLMNERNEDLIKKYICNKKKQQYELLPSDKKQLLYRLLKDNHKLFTILDSRAFFRMGAYDYYIFIYSRLFEHYRRITYYDPYDLHFFDDMYEEITDTVTDFVDSEDWEKALTEPQMDIELSKIEEINKFKASIRKLYKFTLNDFNDWKNLIDVPEQSDEYFDFSNIEFFSLFDKK